MNSIEAPRPLNLGEILDRTVQVYRQRFLVFLGIGIIPTGVLLVFAGSVFLVLAWFGAWSGNGSSGRLNDPAAAVIGVILIGMLSLLALAALLGVSSLSTAAMNLAAAAALAGDRPTIRGSFAQAWRRGWMYIGLYVLQALIVWIAPLIVWFIGLIFVAGLAAGLSRAASGQTAGTLVGLLTLFGFAAVGGYALWMLLCVGMAFPACVVEGIDAGRSLTRSFRLSKGTRGRIFVLYLLGAVLGWILSIVVTVIVVVAAALIPALNSPQNAQALGVATIFLIYGSSFAVQAFTKPVYAIALMLFYYDQRIRKEGFDIEWMMERAGLVTRGATANGEPGLVASGDLGTHPSTDSISAWREQSPLKLVAMKSEFEGEEFGAAHPQTAAKTAAPTDATSATEPTSATQPESRVQE